MKAHFVLIFMLVSVISLNANAGNGNNDPKQQQEQKKTIKPKYDFNIFKLFSIPTAPQVDSLKPEVVPNSSKKTLFFTEKLILSQPKKTISSI